MMPATSPHAERLRAVGLVLAVWAVGFGLAAVLVCERRAVPVVGRAPCILLTVDPPGAAGPVEVERVDVCPGDCTPAGDYCIRVVERPARP